MSKHLAKIKETTSNDIESIGAANSAVSTQFYYAVDTEQFFYGKTDGSMSSPFPIPESLASFTISDGFNAQTYQGASPLTFKKKAGSLFSIELQNNGIFEIGFSTAGATNGKVPTFTDGVITWQTNSNGTIMGVLDTPTMNLGISEGILSADVNLSATVGNILTSDGSGIFAKDISIAVGSGGYLGYNPLTRELSMNPINLIQYKVGEQTDFADWITANYITGAEFDESDIVTLPNATSGVETWINNGGTGNDISDWTLATPTNIDTAVVRSLLNGTAGIAYNSTTGVFNLQLSSTTGNDLSVDGTGLFLDVSESNVIDTVGIGGDAALTVKTVQEMFDDLAAANGSFTFDIIDDAGTVLPVAGGGTIGLITGDMLKSTVVFGSPNKMKVEIDISSGTPGDLLGINEAGNALEWLNTNGSGFIFKNGVKLLNNEVFLGGTFNDPVIIDNNGYDFVIANSGSLKIGGALEFIATSSKMIMRSPDGQKWELYIDNSGFIGALAV